MDGELAGVVAGTQMELPLGINADFLPVRVVCWFQEINADKGWGKVAVLGPLLCAGAFLCSVAFPDRPPGDPGCHGWPRWRLRELRPKIHALSLYCLG